MTCFNPRPPSLTGERASGWCLGVRKTFQSTPAIADGRTLTGASLLAAALFQSTPAIAVGRTHYPPVHRGPRASFNPRPPSLTGERFAHRTLLPNDFSWLFREPVDEIHVRIQMLNISTEIIEWKQGVANRANPWVKWLSLGVRGFHHSTVQVPRGPAIVLFYCRTAAMLGSAGSHR